MFRITFLTLILISLVIGCGGGDDGGPTGPDNDFEEVGYEGIEWHISSETALQVKNINGKIKKDFGAYETLPLEVEKFCRAETEQLAEAYLDSIFVTFARKTDAQGKSDTLAYSVTYPEDTPHEYETDVSFNAPDDFFLDLHTVNGWIEIPDHAAGIVAECTNGDIMVEMWQFTDDVTLSTVNGDVTLRMPGNMNINFSISTSNGTVSVDEVFGANFTRNDGRWKQGTMGTGTYTVTLTAVNGNVSIAPPIVNMPG